MRESPGSSFAARLAPGLVLLAEVLIFYRQVLFDSSRYIIPWDLRYYHFPQAFFMARQLQAGEWPLWNPWVYCGMPWYAKLDSQMFYPPTMLAIVVSNWFGGRRLWYFLELQVIGHVLLAGLFTYLLVRYLGAGRAASLAAATIYQLGAFFATQSQHVGAANSAAWMPLAWLAIAMLARGFSRRRLALLAAALAMVLLSGYPAAGIPVLFSCGLLALLQAAARQARWTLPVHVALAGLWAVALAALPLLPSAELLPLSHAGTRGYFTVDEGGIPVRALITLVSPNHFGVFQYPAAPWTLPWNPTFMFLYCGIPALVFSAAALLLRRCPRTYIYAAIAAVFGVWMLGGNALLGRLLVQILPPFLKGGLYYEFAMGVFVLGLAVVAGLGADRLLRSRPRWLQAAVVAVVAADLILVNSGRPLNTADRQGEPGLGYNHFDSYEEPPRRLRRLTRQAAPPWRIDLMDGSPQWNNGAMLFEVPVATGDDPFAPLRVLRLRELFTDRTTWWQRSNQVQQPDSPLLDYLNVRYVLSQRDLQAPGLRLLERLPEQVVYENPDAMPRFFLVDRVARVNSAAEALERLKTADLRREAVVESADPGWGFGPGGAVRLGRYSANEVVLETETPAGAYLVTSETNYPGWRAWVDGAEQRLYMTNGAFRGLPVPAGRHQVRMRFQPALLWQSGAIAAAAWLLVVVVIAANARAWTRIRKREL